MRAQGGDGTGVWDCGLARSLLGAAPAPELLLCTRAYRECPAAGPVLSTSWSPRPCHSLKATQLWKERLVLCPCLVTFRFFISPPHWLIEFSSFGMSSCPTSAYLNSTHLKWSLLRPIKRCWTLTIGANLIHSDP